MVRIMREICRRQKRDVLRRSVSIPLAFDDRAGYKLVSFRGTHAKLQPGIPASPQGDVAAPASALEYTVTEGIAGCFQVLRGTTMEDFADDFAERAGREVPGGNIAFVYAAV